MNAVGGIICPIVTPLDSSGLLAEKTLRAHIDAIVPDVEGILVMGSSGEFPWLPSDVAAEAIQVVVNQVAGRVPVYQGVGDTSTPRTLARLRRFGEIGADYLVVAPPSYYPTEQAGLQYHYEAVADAAPRRVVLYNIPQNTGTHLPPRVVAYLAEHPNVVGIKDSAGNPFTFLEFLAITQGRDFAVMQGREQLMAISYWQGAAGLVSALANFAPRLLRQTQDAIREGRPTTEVMALQAKVTDLSRLFHQGYWVCALKAALEYCGFRVGPPTPPMSPATDEQRERIAEILDSHRSHLTVSTDEGSA